MIRKYSKPKESTLHVFYQVLQEHSLQYSRLLLATPRKSNELSEKCLTDFWWNTMSPFR